MNISSFAQETMCFVGQNMVFAQASDMINSLTGACFNAKQIERVCHLYGGILEEETQGFLQSGASREYSKEESQELHYAMIDGAMYPTRIKDQPWKELKLGRIIKSSEIISFTKDRNFVETSKYVAHLGEAKDFFPKMEYEIDCLQNVVFICDGAKWIWKWIEETYPDSTQILDFFHAKEHLCEFAKSYFTDQLVREKWIETQCATWLERKPEDVILEIEKLKVTGKNKELKDSLLGYFRSNIERMRYKDFKSRGLLIGSGAIESAHKVFQQRLKLSGQHWSKEGLQKMAQLRVAYKSNQWTRIEEIAKNAA